jgi:hypothetical protein
VAAHVPHRVRQLDPPMALPRAHRCTRPAVPACGSVW